MMTVPFVDLRAQHCALESQITAAVARVINRCDFILGEAVAEFEREFAQFIGSSHAVGVSSGFDALRLSLTAAGVGPGDEVLVPANTFIATALAVSAVGAVPVFVDVEEGTYGVDPARIEAAITPKTKAIIPVHLYGQACDLERLVAQAQAHRLVLIEDACQAHGARFAGRRVGTFGLTGCFSFYPAKNLGACGDGGIIVTDNSTIAQQLRVLRDCGRVDKYRHAVKGLNARLDTLQAAILRIKLPLLEQWNALRAAHAQRYRTILGEVRQVHTPVVASQRTHIFHLYVVRVQQRDKLQKFLADQGVQTGVHYPLPLHLQEAYAELGYQSGSMPVAEQVAGEILSLPMFPEMTETQIQYVCDSVKRFYRT